MDIDSKLSRRNLLKATITASGALVAASCNKNQASDAAIQPVNSADALPKRRLACDIPQVTTTGAMRPFFPWGQGLILTDTTITSPAGKVQVSDLPDPQPELGVRLRGTPILERLWRVALRDVEMNRVDNQVGSYFSTGPHFQNLFFTRDQCYSGVLGLNRLFPERMRHMLESVIWMNDKLGFKVPRGFAVEGIDAPWEEEDIPFVFWDAAIPDPKAESFMTRYCMPAITRRTDEVMWIWCAHDLLQSQDAAEADWRWLLNEGEKWFARFGAPFHDKTDGLYRGQATLSDVHWRMQTSQGCGYPHTWTISDCVLIKATCTNSLYVLGMDALADAARRLGMADVSQRWIRKRDDLRAAMRNHLRHRNGTFAYYLDRWGQLSDRWFAAGSALAVLADVVIGEDAVRAVRSTPCSANGVELIYPPYPGDFVYHNNSSWPFCEALFLRALDHADGQDRSGMKLAMAARACHEGSFREVVNVRTGIPCHKKNFLWGAASFLDACRYAQIPLNESVKGW